MISTLTSSKRTLYEKLADELLRQIEQGTFRPGERLPSVRQSSQQRNLSMTTVLKAYEMLEDRGVIEARPQSGYFVRFQNERPAMECSSPPLVPTEVGVDELVMMVMADTLNPDLVQFGAAIPHPDLLPIEKLNRILTTLARQKDIPHHICAIPAGSEGLRVQIAQRALTAGSSLSPDEIIVTSGALEAVSLSLRTVCKPGDLVAIESPTYFGILHTLDSLGLRALEIPTHPVSGLSLEALRFAVEHHPVRAVLAVLNFNNPLGSCMPDEQKRELVALLAGRDIPLIEDDINGELYFNGQRPKTAKAFDTQGNVLLCASVSKDISPSMRVGWVAPGRYYPQLERLKMATNLGSALMPQYVISAFLNSGGYDHHLRKIRRAYAQKVAQMAGAVIEYFPEETRVTSPGGGFVLWVQLPEKVDSLDMYRLALKSGITLAPGHMFSTTSKYHNFIRLNAAYMSDQNVSAIKQLGKIANTLAR
jgi:DNA-binding transcriptional MocR family regulator